MQAIKSLIENIEKVIIGKRPVIELAVVALFVAATCCSRMCRVPARRCWPGHWRVRWRRHEAASMHTRPAAVGHHRRAYLQPEDRRLRVSSRARYSPTSCWPTRSIGRRRARSRRCWSAWRSSTSASTASARVARAVHGVGDAEPDRHGRHASAAGGAARPLLRPLDRLAILTLAEEVRILAAQALAHPIETLQPVMAEAEILAARERGQGSAHQRGRRQYMARITRQRASMPTCDWASARAARWRWRADRRAWPMLRGRAFVTPDWSRPWPGRCWNID